MRELSRAALYVTVGHPAFPFEKAWLQPLLADLPDLTIVDGSPGQDDPATDPHVWLAPSLVRRMTQEIAQALIQLMPQHTATVTENLDRLLAEIDTVDAEIRETLGRGLSRKFVVFHPSWTHFAEEYGLEQVAVEAEGKEPSPGQLARLLEQLRADGVRVIFTQPAVSSQSAEVIAAEIGAGVQTLDPLARDWPVAMRDAATAIAKALQR
jgi:zinc transport system substrate-binding protein